MLYKITDSLIELSTSVIDEHQEGAATSPFGSNISESSLGRSSTKKQGENPVRIVQANLCQMILNFTSLKGMFIDHFYGTVPHQTRHPTFQTRNFFK